jgi:hypothetical protein
VSPFAAACAHARAACKHKRASGCGVPTEQSTLIPHASVARRWVNNCIGKANYIPFIGLITTVCLLLLVQLGASAYMFVLCFASQDSVRAVLDASYPLPVNLWGYAAGLGAYCALMVFALYYMGELWLLHAALMAKGITTWEYIQVRAPDLKPATKHCILGMRAGGA